MDEQELRSALEQVHADAYAWAVSCCHRDRGEAEDVLHTVYLMVLDGRARFDGRAQFRTWLFGVIRRVAAGARRTAWLRRLLLEREAEQVRPEEPAPASAGAESDDQRATLLAALARLAGRQRQVLELVFYHELSVEDAATVMGVSVGTARTHYARGKARLAAMLAGLRGA